MKKSPTRISKCARSSRRKKPCAAGFHVYDLTYGAVGPEDVLVAIDDSIVRGTTLRRSILRILGRTNPRKIVIASTAPQIRYPDCYGIDMSELGNFIAFQAAVSDQAARTGPSAGRSIQGMQGRTGQAQGRTAQLREGYLRRVD
ncbi:MAG: hypothetical protein ACLSUW_02570 [Akkermansia sp.]